MNTFTSFDGIRIAYHDEGEGPGLISLTDRISIAFYVNYN
jgi:hypothetical protein